MLRLDDWIIEPKYIKKHSNRSTVFETRSVARKGAPSMIASFSAFAWKI